MHVYLFRREKITDEQFANAIITSAEEAGTYENCWTTFSHRRNAKE